MEKSLTINTPIGRLTITATDTAITGIRFGGSGPSTPETPLLGRAADELTEYFVGKRQTFTLPLAPSGTPFQQAVWAALQTIPYGETRTYGQIASQIGRPKACRAVGMGNNRNPIAIVIPCHRVIGSEGTLTGYAGGIRIKQHLLDLEKTRK